MEELNCSNLDVQLWPEHRRLSQLVGQWVGSTRTWLNPDGEPEISSTQCEVRPLLEGLFWLQEYTGKIGGKPHKGYYQYGFDGHRQKFTSTWIDSFHTGSTVMLSEGIGDATSITLWGHYYVGEANSKWGWKTVVRFEDDHRFSILSYNVTPTGQEQLGVEALFSRER